MQDKEINVFDLWKIVWSNRKLIIFFVLIASIIAAGISLILPKWYMANTVILVPEQEKDTFGGVGETLKAFGFGDVVSGNENVFKIIAILKSRSLLYEMNNKFNFQKRYNNDLLEETINTLKERIAVKVEEEGQIVFSIKDRDQSTVADMANYAIKILDSLNIKLTGSYAKNNREFIEGRIKLVKDSLLVYENKLTNFMNDNNVISLEDQLTASIEKAATLKAEIDSKEIERELLSNNLLQESPRIKEIDREIKLLKEKYYSFFKQNPDDVNNLFLEFDEVPKIEMDYLQLKRKIQYFSQLLEFLAPEYEKAKINEIKDIPTIQVLDKAVRPEKRISPKRAVIVIITFITASIIILGYVFIAVGFKNGNTI